MLVFGLLFLILKYWLSLIILNERFIYIGYIIFYIKYNENDLYIFFWLEIMIYKYLIFFIEF